MVGGKSLYHLLRQEVNFWVDQLPCYRDWLRWPRLKLHSHDPSLIAGDDAHGENADLG